MDGTHNGELSKEQPQAEPANCARKIRVAIVGTGLAGLTTAYLLQQDKQKRYHVTLFEQAEAMSLDAASVTVKNDGTGVTERIDIPPRSFCRGYYDNLCRMYDYLGMPFQPISLTWVYAKASATSRSEFDPSCYENAETIPGTYFVYGRRLHEMLLMSSHFWRSSFETILQTFYLAICHIWFFASCFLLAPRRIRPKSHSDLDFNTDDFSHYESFRQYVDRIRLPQQYLSCYLLPVLSVICSCSHAEMMDFPASDVTNFVKGSFWRKTYVNKGGINRVQSALSNQIQDVRLRARVLKVDQADGQVLIRWERPADKGRPMSEEMFDRVVLAVSPNVAAAIFDPAKSTLSMIPTAPVTSSVSAPASAKMSLVHEKGHKTSGECSYRRGDTQVMVFRTMFSADVVRSESLHFLPNGVTVRTSPSAGTDLPKGSLHSATFTRTLRTIRSRRVVNRALRKSISGDDSNCGVWTNGEDGVWITGSWCWDGLVVLEGCVISAMRVARDFGVSIPWDKGHS
ncbi:hypothetical protein QQS21_000494 [Conoideocrella luteorostrata]|uniref:Amine oxidase domain-containing protein n=1 Tax=Conoideocrella luteorostrata TaxID=1105319 RepID=A0AAJ0G2T3_9HYPO|nr:hypothetical protein QQS21_000494 [Conoideocrella luteorostrata]